MLSWRWRFAQEYELPYQVGKITAPEILNIREDANKNVPIFSEFIESFIKITENTRILEVGCGPTGIIFFMNKGKRFGIDPLVDHYKIKFAGLVDFEKTQCVKGAGEQLPFRDKSFDVILIHNVLDHTDDPGGVIQETKRILKNGGITYIGINTYSASVYYLHKLYEFIWQMSGWFVRKRMRIPVFWSHPNIMSEDELFKIIEQYGLKTIFRKSRTSAEAKRIFRNKRRGIFWFLASIFMYSGGFTTVIARR